MPGTRIDSRRWMRLAARVFALALLATTALAWPLVRHLEASRLEVIGAQQQGELLTTSNLFEQEIGECITDLTVLASLPSLQKHLDTPSPETLATLQQVFLSAAKAYRRYDQVRLLDRQGQETVRVNHNGGHVGVMPPWGLQSKADRSYFSQAMALAPGGIYVSGITPNQELGKVELPLKPVIRVATPVFTAAGERAGVLVLNLLAERLTNGMAKIMASNRLALPMVVNETGHWVSHPDASKVFNDLLDLPQPQRFSDQYPAEWAAMLNRPADRLATAHGLFFYVQINTQQLVATRLAYRAGDGTATPTVRSDGAMYLVFHIPPRALASDALTANPWLWLVLGLLVLLLATLSLGGTFAVVFRQAQIATAQHLAKAMAQVAHTDELTGLANRRHFRELAQRELNRAARAHEPLVALMLDIDFFKRINDRHGHKAGDDVLRAFSRTCEAQLRRTDVLGRLGGEEFAVLMPNTPLGTAAMVAERLREAVQAMEVAAGPGHTISLTVSVGMAALTGTDDDLDALLKRADDALYRAKEQGRNRVVACADLAPVPPHRLSA